MRQVNKTSQQKLEIEAAERTERRKGGFEYMGVRDRGWGKLRNGVIIHWHTDAPLEEGVSRKRIPDNHFLLTDQGKSTLFDAEEFRQWLRWA